MTRRGFRHEEWFLHILDWFAVRRDISPGLARRTVEVAESQLGIEALRSWLPAGRALGDDEALREELVRALVNGRLALVKHARAHEPLRSPHVQDLVDLIESQDDATEPQPWLEIRCVGPEGETFAFSNCRVRLPDGTERFERLDHRSAVRLDNLPQGGLCQFELAQDARPDGGRASPEPRAVAYEFGTAAFVHTSASHVLRVSSTSNWIEVMVVDSRGRPVPHLRGSWQTREGDRALLLDADGSQRLDGLPDAAPLSVLLRAATGDA